MERRPRIAIVVQALTGGGGVPSVAAFLYAALQRDGRWECDLFSLPSSRKDPDSVRLLAPRSWLRGVRIREGTWDGRPYRSVGSNVSELKFQRYLPRALLTRQLRAFDLVQVVAGGPAPAQAANAAGRPTVAFIATLVREERESVIARTHGLAKLWLRSMTTITSAIERRALDGLSHVFAESVYTRDLVARLVAPDKLSVAPPGVDTDLFQPRRYRPDGYLLSVGRMDDPRKNVAMLYRGYAALRRRMPHAPRLVLAGQSMPSRADEELARELGIAAWIERRTNPSFEELAATYRDASVFVLTSNEEGLGIVIPEAMASGIPIIAARCGGPDLVVEEGHTGHLVPVGDHEALADRLEHLLQDVAKRTAMAGRAREVAESKYSLDAAARGYFRVYEEILSARRRKG
jgi:glycosyltransferase involved in cell wall biosynthesis